MENLADNFKDDGLEVAMFLANMKRKSPDTIDTSNFIPINDNIQNDTKTSDSDTSTSAIDVYQQIPPKTFINDTYYNIPKRISNSIKTNIDILVQQLISIDRPDKVFDELAAQIEYYGDRFNESDEHRAIYCGKLSMLVDFIIDEINIYVKNRKIRDTKNICHKVMILLTYLIEQDSKNYFSIFRENHNKFIVHNKFDLKTIESQTFAVRSIVDCYSLIKSNSKKYILSNIKKPKQNGKRIKSGYDNKTICKHWAMGNRCYHGSKCNFAHPSL